MSEQVVLRTQEMQRVEARFGKPIGALMRELYIEQELTVEQLGVVLGITKGAASRWLERFDIPTRRRRSKAA